MDINKIIARVKAILMTPKTEWPVIGAEPATVADLYKNYIVILAAIPAVIGFVKASLIGYSVPGFGITYRAPIGTGITSAIVSYALSLALCYVMALIIDALAPSFGGQKNPVQALKAVAYSYTASWVASIALIVPFIGWLVVVAGSIYGIYLLYLGLPATMKNPPEKSAGYTAVAVIVAIVCGFVVSLIVGGIVGTGVMMNGAVNPAINSSGSITIDKDSQLGKLQAWSAKVEAASKQMEVAQKSGDGKAQGEAMGAMMGAALGSGGKVEALAPDMLKPFVPDTLGGLKRTEVSAERNGAMGMQVSEAHASYSDGSNRTLRLEVTDMGTAKGLMALAGWAGIEQSKETEHGYDKTYKLDGRLVHEEWNAQDKQGEYGIVLGERFSVKVSGGADDIGELKAAVASLNLAGLEALKNQGVKNG